MNVDILKLRFPSVFMLLTVGVRTSGLSTPSHAGSISYCGLNSDSLNAIVPLVLLFAFETVTPFLRFSVCLLFLKQTDVSVLAYSFTHMVYLFEITGCLHAR